MRRRYRGSRGRVWICGDFFFSERNFVFVFLDFFSKKTFEGGLGKSLDLWWIFLFFCFRRFFEFWRERSRERGVNTWGMWNMHIRSGCGLKFGVFLRQIGGDLWGDAAFTVF